MAEKKYLAQITSPADLKKLSEEELPALCDEIRETLIETVSQNGGHLASNLGVVELTVALHRMFDSPHDRIVWDVGHQCYTHKLLTGRYDRFDTLRTKGGLSGFTRPDESEHDIFYSGHSATSISAALGLVQANLLTNSDGYTVAVIGDGSFTGGMVFEALNNAVRDHSRMIVILNDNEMSISRNVGTLARYLSRIRTNPKYHRIKVRTHSLLRRIPRIGVRLESWLLRVKTRMKNIIYQATMFEDLGWRYLGPVDGHNMKQLCTALESAKMNRKPVLLHVRTIKGKGYDPAERAPSTFHGISRFDINTGEPINAGTSFSAMFGKYLCEFAQTDPTVCAVTAAMSLGTGLENFRKLYAPRFFDVGIAEEHAVTFCCGLSKGGMKPVFAVYATFLQRCYDQILHDGALQRQKMVLAVDRAGFVGADGETHQGLYDVAFLNSIPGVRIYAPATYAELREALRIGLYDNDCVTAVRYPRGSEPEFPSDFPQSTAPFSVYGDENADTAIVTYGVIAANACRAMAELRRDGQKIKLVKLYRIKPIDPGAIDALCGCKRIFFFDEGVRSAGVGEKTAELLLENGYTGGYHLCAVNDCFVPHADVASQMEQCGLSAEQMIKTVQGKNYGGKNQA